MIAFALLVAASLLGPAAAASVEAVALQVEPKVSLIDAPVRIRVRGVRPQALVTLRARATDRYGKPWESWATFRSDSSGRVDLQHTRPLRGTYARRDGMGLFWSMRPIGRRFGRQIVAMHPAAMARVKLSLTESGRTLAHARIARRIFAASMSLQSQSVASHGFVGRFATPSRGRKPAVLCLGGSNGGTPCGLIAPLLASHGYPTLALAYFRAPGLPRELKRIPLEYFARALRWLQRQPGVDPSKLVILGASRGGEAALLLGATYPRLIHAVAAYVPSAVVFGSFPNGGSPAWTLRGKAVPYIQRDLNDARAIIRVERISGPLFLVSGVQDLVWPSSLYAGEIVSRLKAHNRTSVTSLVYPRAGHAVADAVPYVPFSTAGSGQYGRLPMGGSVAADSAARAHSWPRLLSFLQRLE